MLSAYIEANLAFMGENRALVVAAVEIARNARGADGRPLVDQPGPDTALAELRDLLAHFHGTGEFRAGFDLAHYARELAAIFELATSPLDK